MAVLKRNGDADCFENLWGSDKKSHDFLLPHRKFKTSNFVTDSSPSTRTTLALKIRLRNKLDLFRCTSKFVEISNKRQQAYFEVQHSWRVSTLKTLCIVMGVNSHVTHCLSFNSLSYRMTARNFRSTGYGFSILEKQLTDISLILFDPCHN